MADVRTSIQVLTEAADLQIKKSNDYQNPASTVTQADYYPNGVATIQDIIWAKTLRARSLIEAGGTPNFESLEDTYLDLINYASFAVAWLRKGIPGQWGGRDHLNRPIPASPVAQEQPNSPEVDESGIAKAVEDDLNGAHS